MFNRFSLILKDTNIGEILEKGQFASTLFTKRCQIFSKCEFQLMKTIICYIHSCKFKPFQQNSFQESL